MNIRIAKNESDSIAASYIYAMSWKAGYKGIYSDRLLDDIPVDRWVSAFNSNYETHRFEIAILSVDGEDIGAGGYGLSRDYPDGITGEITSIYFLEKAWGNGYAAHLMDFMIQRLKKASCERVHVGVLAENTRAQRFYEKYGFKLTGSEKPVEIKGETKIVIEYELNNF